MARIFVTPKAGTSPRDPLQPTVRIPAGGDWREDSVAYRRLARAGDIAISAGPTPATPSAAEPAKTPKK